MKIINQHPVLVGKRQYGIWRVKAYFPNDKPTHYKDYKACSRPEAIRQYLMEFGKVEGIVDAFFLEKPIDK